MTDTKKTSPGLWESFHERAADFPRRTAISTAQAEITFGDLFRCAGDLAARIAKAGVREGSTVALVLPNSIAFVPSFLSLTRLSATVLLVPPKYGAGEMRAIGNALRPSCFLTTAEIAEGLARKTGLRSCGIISTACFEGPLELLFPAGDDLQEGEPLQERAALVKFTSGSTGVPKGIVLSAGNVLAEARNVVSTLSLTPEDRILAAVPVFHSYGFDLGVLAGLFSGATLVLREAFVPHSALADMESGGVTVFLGVPSMYRFFLECAQSSGLSLTHVRYLLSCTAPLHPELITEFHARFDAPICQHYGSSETGAVTTHVPSEVMRHPESVGVCMKGVDVSIVDGEGRPVPCGREGEVAIGGPAVAKGYAMGQGEGISSFRGGLYHTGDEGYLDGNGFLYLRGRKGDLINVGGHKVSPLEVAQMLESHPAVREAAVIGVKDRTGEEVVCAAVALKQHATEENILSFCRSRLADYKIPRRIDIVDAIPRGHSGKVRLRPDDFRV
jgi:long-chain acyl-CoA synthetase